MGSAPNQGMSLAAQQNASSVQQGANLQGIQQNPSTEPHGSRLAAATGRARQPIKAQRPTGEAPGVQGAAGAPGWIGPVDAQAARRAIVMAEIIGPPVSKRRRKKY